MHKWRHWRLDLLAVGIITGTLAFFFLPLFFPNQKLLVTPDFGRLDSIDFSFATKYILWKNLRSNSLPLWTPQLGAGFPLLAEGQTGTFFLPNLILFRFIPDPVTAYNLALVTAVLTLATGTYALLRALRISSFPALFGGLTIALSGLVVPQLSHVTLLQGFSLLPWVFLATVALIRAPSLRRSAVLALVLSQQVFTGFPQAAFITLILSTGYLLWSELLGGAKPQTIILFAVSTVLGAGLSAVQLVPSWEFLKQTTEPGGFPAEVSSYFSFPLRHLLSFVNPFALGNPKVGTYPSFSSFNGSIFWENTGYVGIFPLILIIPALWRRTPTIRFFLWAAAIAFLLMWGSNSPVYLIYSFWPFNLFRVPSRFLWVFVFAIIAMASIALGTLFHKLKHPLFRFLLLALATINVIELSATWRSYNLLIPAKTWMEPPKIMRSIRSDARILSVGNELVHNSFFLTKGWQDGRPFTFLRNSLPADSNALWGTSRLDVYAGRFLKRTDIISSLLAQNLRVRTTEGTPSAVFKKLLDLSSVDTLLSAVPLDQSEIAGENNRLVPADSVEGGGIRISLYRNPGALPRSYIATGTTPVQTIEEVVREITSGKERKKTDVLIEKPQPLAGIQTGSSVKIIRAEDTLIAIEVRNNPAKNILVLNDTIYPGWVARVDGAPTAIFPVNIQFRGIILPEGTHTVTFNYQPRSFLTGGVVTAFSLFVTFLLLAFPVLPAPVQSRPGVRLRGQHFPNNRGTSRLRRG